MSGAHVDPTEAGDDRFCYASDAPPADSQFEDAMTVISQYYPSGGTQVGPNPTGSSFAAEWSLRNSVGLESIYDSASSTESSPAVPSLTPHSNSPGQESDRDRNDGMHAGANPTVGSFGSDWNLYEFESVSIYNSSYPASLSNSSPLLPPLTPHDESSPGQETDSASPPRFQCNECGKTFSTKNNCQRHRRDMHRSNSSSPFIGNQTTNMGMTESANMIPVVVEKPKLDCRHPNCKRKGKMGFNRRDNLIQHCRNVHNEKIPKRHRKS